jgi:hypothetical protein
MLHRLDGQCYLPRLIQGLVCPCSACGAGEYSVATCGEGQFDDLIPVRKTFARRVPSQGSVKSIRWQGGVRGSGEPNPLRIVGAYEIND